MRWRSRLPLGDNVSTKSTKRFLPEALSCALGMSIDMIRQLSREFAEKSAEERDEAVESLVRASR